MDLGIGFGEIVLILVIALIVFGPGRLPEIARTIGRFSRSLKKVSSEFTTAMTRELDLEEKSRQTHLKPAEPEKDIPKVEGVQPPGDSASSALPNTLPESEGQPTAPRNPPASGKA